MSTSLDSKYLCTLEPNEKEGHWEIGNRKYAPRKYAPAELPRGQPSQEITDLMCRRGIEEGRKYFERKGQLPERIKILKEGSLITVSFPTAEEDASARFDAYVL